MTTQNPYAPPGAALRDAPAPLRVARPRRIALAIAMTFVGMVVDAVTTYYTLIPNRYSNVDPAVLLVVGSAGLAVFGLLAAMVYKGANWARLASLVLLLPRSAVGLLAFALTAFDPLAPWSAYTAGRAAVWSLQGGAAFLLLTPTASRWFKPRR